MKFIATVAVLASLVLGAYGSCDNACSGHGTCGHKDVCQCYQNWRIGDEDGGDCSDRQCPYELAWVDKPDKSGYVHKYAECAGRGICDRTTGECQCFDGYSGKGCQRSTCANDCSGHGTCEYIEELAYGTVFDDFYDGINDGVGDQPKTFGLDTYWDKHKTMGCKCDPLWTDVDCSRRMCPRGTDVLQERYCGSSSTSGNYQIQTIHLKTGYNVSALNLHYLNISEWSDHTFALQFTSTLNETYVTKPIRFPAAHTDIRAGIVGMDDAIESALEELPHQVIDDVDVSVRVDGYTPARTDNFNLPEPYLFNVTIAVTFRGLNVQGPQHLLSVLDYSCGAGCTPKLDGIALRSFFDKSYVTETTPSDYNNYECGRRGKCDYDTGLCQCFDGYTGPSCATQTALI